MATAKPRSHHKRPVAENEAPQDAPITNEELSAQMELLTERAKAAGLNPLKTLVRTYAKLGMGMMEGFLESLENADGPKKKKE